MSFQASSVSWWVQADVIDCTSSLEVFKWSFNVFIKKNLDKTATWHQDENIELSGSFNFRSFSPCNCSQKLLYIPSLTPHHQSPTSVHEKVFQLVAWTTEWCNKPLYSFLGCCEKRFINLIIDLKVLTICKLMKWNFNCTYLDKVEKYVYVTVTRF